MTPLPVRGLPAVPVERRDEGAGLLVTVAPAGRVLRGQQRGDADALLERLFVAQFQRGEYVGDISLLAEIAAESGYDAAEVANYLASADDEALLRTRERQLRAMGVNMVPTFIVAGDRVIVGAEDPAVLARCIIESLPEAAGRQL